MSAYDFDTAAAEDPLRPVEGTLTQIECKFHPGGSINRSHNACRFCGVYNGVAANFQIVTYRLVPVEVRQCLKEDL